MPTPETKLPPAKNVIFVKESEKPRGHNLLHNFRKSAQKGNGSVLLSMLALSPDLKMGIMYFGNFELKGYHPGKEGKI